VFSIWLNGPTRINQTILHHLLLQHIEANNFFNFQSGHRRSINLKSTLVGLLSPNYNAIAL